jgi:hypothetical protein
MVARRLVPMRHSRNSLPSMSPRSILFPLGTSPSLPRDSWKTLRKASSPGLVRASGPCSSRSRTEIGARCAPQPLDHGGYIDRGRA